MKHFIVAISILLGVTSFVEIKAQNNANIVDYTLNLSFDKDRQKIIARLRNNSTMDLSIKKDSGSPSFFSDKIHIFAFEDAENLSQIQLHFSTKDDPDSVSIKPNEYFEKEIYFDKFKQQYCNALKRNPIIFFWAYGYNDSKYILFQSTGAFRIDKGDVNCE